MFMPLVNASLHAQLSLDHRMIARLRSLPPRMP